MEPPQNSIRQTFSLSLENQGSTVQKTVANGFGYSVRCLLSNTIGLGDGAMIVKNFGKHTFSQVNRLVGWPSGCYEWICLFLELSGGVIVAE